MTETPKKGGCFGRSIVTVILVLIVACVVCGIAGYFIIGPSVMNVVNTFAAPLTAGNEFMTDLVAKDYTKAYALVHPSQQEAFGGSPEGMQQKLDSGSMLPTTFALTNIQIGTDAIVNGTGTFNGAQKYVYISLRKDGDNWKVIGLDVNDNAPTATPASK